jgi:hypothetical protein
MLQGGRWRVCVPMRSLNFINLPNPFGALGPGVYSASNRNEYQKQKECFWAVERGWRVRLTASQPSMNGLSRRSGILQISQPNRQPRPITQITLLLPFCINIGIAFKTTNAINEFKTKYKQQMYTAKAVFIN